MPNPQHMTAVKQWVKSPNIAERLLASLPAGWSAKKRENMGARIQQVMLTLSRQYGMEKISPQKIAETMIHIGEMGLDPTPVLGQVYAIPFGGKNPTLQIIVGYRGYLELGYRSERLQDLHANVVFEGEHFVYRDGKELVLEHEPDLTRDHTGEEPIVTYAVAHLKGGGHVARVLSKFEVLKFKKRSSAVKSGKTTPWDTDPDAMFMKTAVRRLSPWLPQSSETFELAWKYDMDQDPREGGLELANGETLGETMTQGVDLDEKDKKEGTSPEKWACPDCGEVFENETGVENHACPAKGGTSAAPKGNGKAQAPEKPKEGQERPAKEEEQEFADPPPGYKSNGPPFEPKVVDGSPLTLDDFTEVEQELIMTTLKKHKHMRKAGIESWLGKQTQKDYVLADIEAIAKGEG